MIKRKIVMVPNYTKGNPYLTLLSKSMDCEVVLDDLPGGNFPLTQLMNKHPSVNVIHLHWISEIIKNVSWSSNDVVFYLKCILLALDCLFVRVRGRRLVWTIHNKLAHEGFDSKKELFVRKIYALFSKKIILHSAQALREISKLYEIDISKKTLVTYHGNYDGCYPGPSMEKIALREKFGFNEGKLVALYFGNIKPYKGIENLLACYNDASRHVRLIIAGAVKDEKYAESLESMARECVLFDFRFVDDQSLSDYFSLSDVVVLPFNDTLTSGSVVLAMTFGKPLVMSESAKVLGCVPDAGVKYFSTNEELTHILSNLSETDLVQMGKANSMQSQEMDWRGVGSMTQRAYFDDH